MLDKLQNQMMNNLRVGLCRGVYFWLCLAFFISPPFYTRASGGSAMTKLLATEKLAGEKTVWVDPGFKDNSQANSRANNGKDRAVVWFDEQFLGDGKAYLRRAKEFSGWKRRDLREAVVATLKRLNAKSFEKAKSALAKLEKEGKVTGVRPHWIINGFTCVLNEGGIEALKTLPGVRKIFQGLPEPGLSKPPNLAEYGARFVTEKPAATPFDPDRYEHTWNVEKIGAARTWKELHVTGKGTINVIHDFGFKLDVPNLVENLYRNPKEVPGNRIDDDKNGYVDDYHGFDFDSDTPALNIASTPVPGLIHGSLCAGITAGTGTKDTPVELGIAPESTWVPLMGIANFEQAIEWAIEHEADTFSMSYSLPGFGEYRSHWRKAMEQAAFCGLFLVTGAGNFADEKRPTYAPVPIQMRIPEDIPEAVFGVAGVDKNLNRPGFSSQGPVEWNTDHYKDGTAAKPDIDGFNFEIPYMNALTGKMSEKPIQGNSCAGPHIAGVLALMVSADPDLLPWDARKILISTATDVLAPGFDYQSGYGLANAYEAVKEVLRRKDVANNKARGDKATAPQR